MPTAAAVRGTPAVPEQPWQKPALPVWPRSARQVRAAPMATSAGQLLPIAAYRRQSTWKATQRRAPPNLVSSLLPWDHSLVVRANGSLPETPERPPRVPAERPADWRSPIADRDWPADSRLKLRWPGLDRCLFPPSARVSPKTVRAPRRSTTDPCSGKKTGLHPNCKLQRTPPEVRHRATGSPKHLERQSV